MSASAAWEAEATKRPRDRQLFRFEEVGNWLAREPGRLTADRDEARRIVYDIFDWYERGEFDQSDILVPVGNPPYFLSVYSFLKSSRDPQERIVREQEIHNYYLIPHLILRRTALEVYLSRCGLGGALRLSRELGFEEPAAVPELATHKGAGDTSNRPDQEASAGEAGAGINEGTQPSSNPPAVVAVDLKADKAAIDETATVPLLEEWIFGRHPRPPTADKPLTYDKLVADARQDRQLGTFTEANFRAAYRAVYITEANRPPITGWPLQRAYRHRLEQERKPSN